MIIASFDLGTNSFLCHIAEISKDNYNVLYDDSKIVRLGEGMYDSSKFRIKEAALVRAKDCLRSYMDEVSKYKVDAVLAVATSAARDAENACELIDYCESLGIQIEIISGHREAELTYLGSVESNDIGKAVVVDVGGGSTEILSSGNEILANSLDIGAVRITERFLKHDPPIQEEINKARCYIIDKIKTLNLNLSPKVIYAVAGTPTVLVKMNLKLKQFDPQQIHMQELSVSDLDKWIEVLSAKSIEERKKIEGLDHGRADIILAGAMILRECLNYFSMESYLVSIKGVRYGLAQDYFNNH